MLVSASPLYNSLRVQIGTAAARHGIPALAGDDTLTQAGLLASYSSRPEENWRLVGMYAGRILKGEKPADMPVQLPTKFEFVINMQTARTLGIDVPTSLLARADEVIE